MVDAGKIRNASILVVDDDEQNLLLIEQMLKTAGYVCVDATSDPHAVSDLHRAKRYSLIILDLQMPEMDGFDVMEGLRPIEAGSYLPVLALTGQPSHKLRALESGAKDFISKPFDPPEFLTRVNNLLEVRLLHEESREHARMLEALALHDPLTGMANRRLLLDRLAMAIAQAKRGKGCMAIMYLDLDGFKSINDMHGHAAGDALLKAVSRRLSGAVREEDTVARLGGDEFVVTLPHIHSTGDAMGMAQKILGAVSKPYDLDAKSLAVTISIGIGIYPQSGKDVDALMKAADAALYEAKRAGKNIYRIAPDT
ncbi:MAG TPA: diguanylate cyclase [Burkholderiales bacterium]|nr:diguanylate cyclase [Burkholderiales bacterium]